MTDKRVVRVTLVFLLFMATACQTSLWRTPSSDGKVIDVVFDLDWTIVSLVDESHKGAENVYQVGEEFYRVNDWAREMITALHNNPRYRVSFFSGGPIERNLGLLSQIQLLDGSKKSFADIAYKKLHRQDLLNIEPSPDIVNPRPADWWKKDLRKVNPDLERVLIVEDDHRHALNVKQRQNNLWTGKGFYHYDLVEALDKDRVLRPTNEFIPETTEVWNLQRNKLAVAYGIILEATDEYDQNGGSFTELVQRKVQSTGMEENQLNNVGKSFFYAGSAKLKKINAKAQKVAIDSRCFDLLSPFLRSVAL